MQLTSAKNTVQRRCNTCVSYLIIGRLYCKQPILVADQWFNDIQMIGGLSNKFCLVMEVDLLKTIWHITKTLLPGHSEDHYPR